MKQLSLLTEKEIARDQMKALIRENVRAGLASFLRNAYTAPDPPDFDVVFRDEQARLEGQGGSLLGLPQD